MICNIYRNSKQKYYVIHLVNGYWGGCKVTYIIEYNLNIHLKNLK